jgi:hypothetical protein
MESKGWVRRSASGDFGASSKREQGDSVFTRRVTSTVPAREETHLRDDVSDRGLEAAKNALRSYRQATRKG